MSSSTSAPSTQATAAARMPSTDAPKEAHITKDQDPAAAAAAAGTAHGDYQSSAVDLLSQQYTNHNLYKQHQQYTEQATPFNSAGLAAYPHPYCHPTAPYPTAPAAEAQHTLPEQEQQQYPHQQQQQQQQLLLPEAAPAPKTDPVELSLLASYLEVVRQTQGDAAAAEALAASGADAASLGNAVTNSSVTSGPHPHNVATDSTRTTGKEGGTPGTAGAGASAAEASLAVDNLLGFIKQRKLTGLQQTAPSRRPSSGAASTASSTSGSAAGQQATNAAGRKIWIQPSGPRRPGEGVENEEQGILSAEEVTATGEVMMRITLLAAGFVIGPSGASVREIVRLSGADVNSWTESAGSHRGRRPARIFVIKGEPRCVGQAIYIVTAAVDRYKELCEGKYTGQSVPRAQNVLGVTFSYQPPPKSIVPCAASLKELYAPVNSVASHARFGASSPPGLYPSGRMPNPHTLRGPANAYDPAAWMAMMTAAAQMGMNPFAAAAAAGANPAAAAAALGYNPYQNPFGGFNPAAGGGFNPMGGFGATAQNPMAGGLGSGAGLDSMVVGGLGFGMGPPLLNPNSSTALLGHTGDMFGGGVSLFGGAGGLNPGLEGGQNPADMTAATAAGYGGAWGSSFGPSMMDPSGFPAMMNTGLFGMPAAAAAGGFAAGASPGYDAMAAMAAAGMHPAAALAAEDSSGAPFGTLLQGPSSGTAPVGSGAVASVPTDAGSSPGGGGAARRLSRANSSGSSSRAPTAAAAAAPCRAHSGPENDIMTPRGTTGGDASTAAAAICSSSSSTGVGTAAGKPVGKAAAAAGWAPVAPPPHYAPAPPGSGIHRRLPPPPPLQIPPESSYSSEQYAAASGTAGEGSTTPRSPAVVRGGHGGVGYPAAPQSPHMLGPFGQLFHPMSPAAPIAPYGPLPGMPPYAAASPIRIMHDKSGQPVPYMEVGGTTYFPASPMPPHRAMAHSLFSPTPPHHDPHYERQLDYPEESRSPAEYAGGAAAGGRHEAGSGSAGEHVGDGSAGKQRGGRARPPSGHTPLRMAGHTALRLLEDNPYLVQDIIGSNKSPENAQYHAGGHHSGSANISSSGGSGSRQYGRGGSRGSPRRGHAASPRQQQQQGWQARRSTGSSNSVSGSAGYAAAGSSLDDVEGRDVSDAAAAAGGRGPGFDAAAISAALALPGSGNSSNLAATRDNSRPASGGSGKAHLSNQQYRDNNRFGYSDSSNRSSDQLAGAGEAISADPAAAAAAAAAAVCVKPGLTVIPETAPAADGSPSRVGISSSRYGSDGRPLSYSQLGAQDPIVSPGRINLASKVKAARFSAAAAHAAAGGMHSPGSD